MQPFSQSFCALLCSIAIASCSPSQASLVTASTMSEHLESYTKKLNPDADISANQLALKSLNYAAAVAQQSNSSNAPIQLLTVHQAVIDEAHTLDNKDKQPFTILFNSLLDAVPQHLSTTQQQLTLLFQLKQQLNKATMSCIKESNLPLYQYTDDTHAKTITTDVLESYLNAAQATTPYIIDLNGSPVIVAHINLLKKLLPAPQPSLQKMVLSGVITSSTMYLLKLFLPRIIAIISTKK